MGWMSFLLPKSVTKLTFGLYQKLKHFKTHKNYIGIYYTEIQMMRF